MSKLGLAATAILWITVSKMEQILWYIIDICIGEGRIPALREIASRTGLPEDEVSKVTAELPELRQLFSFDEEEKEEFVSILRKFRHETLPQTMFSSVVTAKLEVANRRLEEYKRPRK